MTFEQFHAIYNEMIATYKKDTSITHIEVHFQIQPITTEKKTAIINVSANKNK